MVSTIGVCRVPGITQWVAQEEDLPQLVQNVCAAGRKFVGIMVNLISPQHNRLSLNLSSLLGLEGVLMACLEGAIERGESGGGC
jgi:hypothetical protein